MHSYSTRNGIWTGGILLVPGYPSGPWVHPSSPWALGTPHRGHWVLLTAGLRPGLTAGLRPGLTAGLKPVSCVEARQRC